LLYEVCLAGADGFGPPVAESESAALPLGEAPIKKALHWSAVQILSAEGLYRMAGVDGIKPPFADLESAVLLTELNS
jgi:hypothetical protein